MKEDEKKEVKGTMAKVIKPKTQKKTPKAAKKAEVKHYDMVMWKGRIPVFICKECGRQMDSEASMIVHVLKHYPQVKDGTDG